MGLRRVTHSAGVGAAARVGDVSGTRGTTSPVRDGAYEVRASSETGGDDDMATEGEGPGEHSVSVAGGATERAMAERSTAIEARAR